VPDKVALWNDRAVKPFSSMASPRLLLARPVGQTAVRAIFDMPMRQMIVGDLTDPRTVSLWTSGGGLPAVVAVIKNSPVEFDLILASLAPIATGYTITVADTVQSAAGEFINGAARAVLFDVTVPDLTVTGLVWVSAAVFDLTFSGVLSPIDEPVLAVDIQPTNGGCQLQVIGMDVSGSSVRVTTSTPGTSGAGYLVSLNRELFIDASTQVALKAGDEVIPIFGQGSLPSVVAISTAADSVQATFSDVLNFGSTPSLPPFIGAYSIDSGSLGNDVEFPSASVVKFPSASLTEGATVSWSVASLSRSLAAGQSWSAAATSFVGAGTEATGVGTTTLSKTLGDPFELVFSGGSDSVTRAGRRLQTTMAFTFTPSGLMYPLLAITFLNTQLSLVFSKTANNLVSARLYRGALALGSESDALPTSFALSLIDASLDQAGFVSVSVNGQVVLGATAKDVVDSLLTNNAAGNTAVAITLGSPLANQAFSVLFSSNFVVKSFLTTGLRGQQSRDLLSFSGAGLASIVTASSYTPNSPGYQNTGKAAFGVYAEYMDSVDAIQVVIGLNEEARPLQFTGSVTLMTAGMSPIDQVLFDQSNVLVGENEMIAVFLHPKRWLGVMVGVAIDIDDVTYSVVVPVADGITPHVQGQFTQQPAHWGHPRLPKVLGDVFGPATIMLS